MSLGRAGEGVGIEHQTEIANNMSTKGKEDDKDSLFGGDLGLGRGLKPGGIPFHSDLTNTSWNPLPTAGQQAAVRPTTPSTSTASLSSTESSECHAVDQVCDKCRHTPTHVIKCKTCRHDYTDASSPKHFLEKLSKPMRKSALLRMSNNSENPHISPQTQGKDADADDGVPIFADVPIGTSIRQQKMLYEKNRNNIRQEMQSPEATQNILKKRSVPDDSLETVCSKRESELLKGLRMAEREIEILRHDLENSEKISVARCNAIRLFKGQSYAVQTQQLDSAKKANQLNKTLQDEINRIQFELEYQKATTMTSQEMWTARFSRVTEENAALMSSNEELSAKTRQLQGEKLALMRERDELLALLDVQERQRYEATRSQSSDDSEYSSFTSTELAVLGACRCRINSPQPCGCAHAAAITKREIARLRSEMSATKKRADESVILADSYRIAFEEQLNRNSALTRRLVEMTSMNLPNMKTVGKPRAALRWLIKQLNEEDYLPPRIPPEVMSDKVEETNSKDNPDIQQGDSSSELKDYKTPPSSVSEDQPERLESCSNVDQDEWPSEQTEVSKSKKDEAISNPSGGIHVGNGEVNSEEASNKDRLADSADSLENKKDEDIMNMLLEMISERTEALVHQRLAARMLAKKLTDAESKLAALTEEVFDK